MIIYETALFIRGDSDEKVVTARTRHLFVGREDRRADNASVGATGIPHFLGIVGEVIALRASRIDSGRVLTGARY